jgi:hypothetical protein
MSILYKEGEIILSMTEFISAIWLWVVDKIKKIRRQI